MSVKTLFNEGLNLGLDREWERALACLERVLELEPGHARARYNIGICLLMLGRFIEPAEIANAVAFIASPLASAINGSAVRVDGGALTTVL